MPQRGEFSCTTRRYTRFSGPATTASYPSSRTRKYGYRVSSASAASPITTKIFGMNDFLSLLNDVASFKQSLLYVQIVLGGIAGLSAFAYDARHFDKVMREARTGSRGRL